MRDAIQRRRGDDAAEGARRAEADVVGHDQEHVGAPLGGTTRGGHQGFDCAAFSLITPPNCRVRRRELFPVDRRRGAGRARYAGAFDLSRRGRRRTGGLIASVLLDGGLGVAAARFGDLRRASEDTANGGEGETRGQSGFELQHESSRVWKSLQIKAGIDMLELDRNHTFTLSAPTAPDTAQRSAGNLDHSLERLIQFQDQKNRAGNRQRAYEQGS